MQPPFEFVDHTADYAIRAWGRDFPDLLQNAARGFMALLADVAGLVPSRTQEITVEGDSREQVLVHALKELLLLEEEGLLPVSVQVTEATDCSARLVVGTVELASARDRLGALVKAVTYHGLAIEEQDEGLTVRVVFDT